VHRAGAIGGRADEHQVARARAAAGRGRRRFGAAGTERRRREPRPQPSRRHRRQAGTMILGWISGRGALGAVAWAALSLVLWYAGDALTLAGSRPLEQPTHRVAMIAAIAIVWLIWEMLRVRRLARENARLLDGLIGDSIGADSSARATHEAAVLQKRF